MGLCGGTGDRGVKDKGRDECKSRVGVASGLYELAVNQRVARSCEKVSNDGVR